MTEKRVVVVPTPTDLAESVAKRFLGKVAMDASEDRPVHVSLTGGTMGIAVLAAVAENPLRDLVNWSAVHFWWSDERWVPRGDADRNELQAREALLDQLSIPSANIHEMPASDEGLTLDEAADAYAAELAGFSTETHAWPSFDVCFLGVGPDGHIASLFPDRPAITVTDAAAVAVRNSPKPPAERISLTRPVINSSRRVWMVVAGEEKAGALGLILAGANYEQVPAAGAKGTSRTIIIVDEAAAGQVPAELIDPTF